MVWPFFFLVPLSLLLLQRGVTLVSDMSVKVSELIECEQDAKKQYEHECFLHTVRKTLASRRDWFWSIRSAYTVGSLFWAYNFIACTVPIDLPSELRMIERFLNPYAGFAKWDVDPGSSLFSWFAARVWTLFGYGIGAVVMVKMFHLIGIVGLYARWLRESKVLTLRPLSPGNRGGLASLAAIYLVIPLSLMAFAATFKEAIPPGPQNQILMYGLAPAAVLLFTLSIISAHRAIHRAKEEYLSSLSGPYDSLTRELLRSVGASVIATQEIERLSLELKVLRNLYDRAKGVGTWPVGRSTAGGLSVPVIVQVVLLVAKALLSDR